MMNDRFLGIDTSNYKTSVALTDNSGDTVYSRSELLDVDHGKCGLRQSEAFFRQTNAMPGFIADVFRHADAGQISAVAVSDAPRRIEGSYMPVFLAGLNAAKIISTALGVEMYTFSHQEGHIAAATSTLDIERGESFIFFHLSGGTTECLLCREHDCHYDTKIIGGTLDISIGQLLDRVGVRAGYDFPAGKYLDSTALSSPVDGLPCRVNVKDGYFNLSGLETQMIRHMDSGDTCMIPGLFERIAELIYDEAVFLSEKYNIRRVCIAGGVGSSRTIRKRIPELAEAALSDTEIMFGVPELSGDNATGISLLGGRAYNETRHCKSGK